MSVIAAKVETDRITVACDSILLKGELKRTKNFNKVKQYKDILVGGCGSAEELSLFERFAETCVPVDATISDLQDYMLKFTEFKYKFTNNDTIENCYIVVYKDHLYEIDGMFVQEISDYTACGEGECFALTALYLGHSVGEAVHATCELCHEVSLPVHVYTVYKTIV